MKIVIRHSTSRRPGGAYYIRFEPPSNFGDRIRVIPQSFGINIDAFISIDDDRARDAIRLLAQAGLIAGETGAAGLGGLLELLTRSENARHRKKLAIDDRTRVLLVITEGATDPQAWSNVVG